MDTLEKFKSRKEWEEYIWEKILNKQSLGILLTAYEKKQIIKRAAAISLLRRGKSYTEIGNLLWLSPTTISAIRKSLRSSEEYISRYARKKKQEKKQKPLSKEEIDQLLFSAKVSAFFTLPDPPIPHARLNRQLGRGNYFPKKQKY